MMRFPIIKVKDSITDTEHIIGTDIDDLLRIDSDGKTISYLKNGFHLNEQPDYSFKGHSSTDGLVTVELVTFYELKKIYNQQLRMMKKESKIL